MCYYLQLIPLFSVSQHVFTMDPMSVENGRGKVPHDPSVPFASTFIGTAIFFHVLIYFPKMSYELN